MGICTVESVGITHRYQVEPRSCDTVNRRPWYPSDDEYALRTFISREPLGSAASWHSFGP